MKSMRDLLKSLPLSGEIRYAFREFNLAPKVDGKARSVKALAMKLGFDVIRVPLPRGMAGRLVRDAFAENGFRIEINEKHSVESQRWSVLHELAHFFLHVDKSDPFTFDMHLDRSSDRFYFNTARETQANEFAAVLLFGDGALESAKSLYGGDVTKLSRHFGVSVKSIEFALKQF